MRVLVVDDEPEGCRAAGRLLRVLGAEVLCAGSAEEAWVSLQENFFDVLLSDLDMPGTSGHELIERVRSSLGQISTLHAVALTGSPSDGQRHRALSSGFDVFLAKPANARDLVAAIAMARRRL